jgi:hypothetical protein
VGLQQECQITGLATLCTPPNPASYRDDEDNSDLDLAEAFARAMAYLHLKISHRMHWLRPTTWTATSATTPAIFVIHVNLQDREVAFGSTPRPDRAIKEIAQVQFDRHWNGDPTIFHQSSRASFRQLLQLVLHGHGTLTFTSRDAGPEWRIRPILFRKTHAKFPAFFNKASHQAHKNAQAMQQRAAARALAHEPG